jgi:hypothetical protein
MSRCGDEAMFQKPIWESTPIYNNDSEVASENYGGRIYGLTVTQKCSCKSLGQNLKRVLANKLRLPIVKCQDSLHANGPAPNDDASVMIESIEISSSR